QRQLLISGLFTPKAREVSAGGRLDFFSKRLEYTNPALALFVRQLQHCSFRPFRLLRSEERKWIQIRQDDCSSVSGPCAIQVRQPVLPGSLLSKDLFKIDLRRVLGTIQRGFYYFLRAR